MRSRDFGINVLSSWSLCSHSEGDVDLLELVETSQDTSASNTTEDVGTSSLHHGHEAFVLEDLHTAVDGALVLDGGTGSHHHTTPDGVDGVGQEAGADGHTPTQEEGQEQGLVVSQEDGLEGIVHAEVHATVDEDTDAGDGETTVQALDTVGLEGLPVDIDEAVVLAFSTLALGIIGEPEMKITRFIMCEKTREIKLVCCCVFMRFSSILIFELLLWRS